VGGSFVGGRCRRQVTNPDEPASIVYQRDVDIEIEAALSNWYRSLGIGASSPDPIA
jgi:hypothetical protein